MGHAIFANMKNLVLTFVQFLFPLVLTSGVPNAPDIRSVDFKNFLYPWDHDESKTDSVPSLYRWIIQLPERRVRVFDGVHRFSKPGAESSEQVSAPVLRVLSVAYGDLRKDGIENTAVVHLNYSTGGTRNWDFLYIYIDDCKPVTGCHLQLLEILESGSRADGGLVGTAIKDNMLVLDFADANRRVGDCCSEGYVRIHFRLHKDGTFAEEGLRQWGDLNLQSQ